MKQALVWVRFALAVAASCPVLFDDARVNAASVIVNKDVLGDGLTTLSRGTSVRLQRLLKSGGRERSRRAVQQTQLALGVLLDRQGDRQEAVRAWRAAEADRTWAEVGDWMWRAKAPTRSTLMLRRAIDTNPTRLEYYFLLAWLHWPGMGQVDAARRVYQEAANVAPHDSFEYALARGQILRLDGLWEPALDMFERALTVKPERSDVHRLVAEVARRVGKSALAAKHLRMALKLSPTDSFIRVELGDVERGAGRLTEASAWYSEAARIYPGNIEAHKGHAVLAATYLAQGATADAVRECELAISGSPSTAEYWRQFGEVLELAGEFGRARDVYRQALVLDPADEAAKLGMERLHDR